MNVTAFKTAHILDYSVIIPNMLMWRYFTVIILKEVTLFMVGGGSFYVGRLKLTIFAFYSSKIGPNEILSK